MKYNVPVLGNLTVEANSPEEAIQIVEDTLHLKDDGGGTLDSLDVLGSLDIDNTGVSEL